MKRIAFAALAALLVTGAAMAEPQVIRIEGSAPFASGAYRMLATDVRYDDLDMSSPAGVAVLYQRLEAASHAVCAEKFAWHLTDHLAKQYVTCRTDAVREALARAHLPKL